MSFSFPSIFWLVVLVSWKIYVSSKGGNVGADVWLRGPCIGNLRHVLALLLGFTGTVSSLLLLRCERPQGSFDVEPTEEMLQYMARRSH